MYWLCHDGGSSDLDTDGNIIPGGTKMLTPEEFEEIFANMGESKNSNKDEQEREESDNYGIIAIYTNYDINALVDEEDDWETWLADTGASCHVTKNAQYLLNS